MRWLTDWLGAAGLGLVVGLLAVGGLWTSPAAGGPRAAQQAGAGPCADPAPRVWVQAGPGSRP